MNFNELNNKRQREYNILTDLSSKNGSCLANGFLGEDNVEFFVDDSGILEYKTLHSSSEFETYSIGAILSDSVLIKQTQKNDNRIYNQLISWDVGSNSYTYVAFDNAEALDDCYEKLKSGDVNLSKKDISTEFSKLGISFDGVAQVLLNQKVDELSFMVESVSSSEINKSASNRI